MTGFSDFPPDVQAAASECADRIAASQAPGVSFRDAVELEIARAIAAEREACAVRAEALDKSGREWVADSLWARIKADTAADIRRCAP